VIRDTTTENFESDVVTESWRQPVLVDFWAEWCSPCRWLAPVLEQAVRAAGGKVRLVKLNIDHYPEIPGEMGINSIPTVIVFVDGQPADGFTGSRSGTEVRAFIERITRNVVPPNEANGIRPRKEAEVIAFSRAAQGAEPSGTSQEAASSAGVEVPETLPGSGRSGSGGSVRQDNQLGPADSLSMRPVLALVFLVVIVLVAAVVGRLLRY